MGRVAVLSLDREARSAAIPLAQSALPRGAQKSLTTVPQTAADERFLFFGLR